MIKIFVALCLSLPLWAGEQTRAPYIIHLKQTVPSSTYMHQGKTIVEPAELVSLRKNLNNYVTRDLKAPVEGHLRIRPAIVAWLTPEQAQRVASHDGVQLVEKDRPMTLDAQSTPYGINRVQAPQAWPTTTGGGVAVAVLDSGVDYTHPDLVGNWAGGYDVHDDDPDPMPGRWANGAGHGTHVAGTIAAVNNDEGVVGVAHGADLYGIKVTDAVANAGQRHLAWGLEWCVANGMDIVNISMSSNWATALLIGAMEEAYQQGILVVSTAGNNSGSHLRYPGALPQVMGITATDSSDNFASAFAHHGLGMDASAPGVSVYSTFPLALGEYHTMTGTSMAAPHAAGVAVLVKGAHPSYNREQILAAIQRSAYDRGAAGWDEYYGYGRVDAQAAVAYDFAGGEPIASYGFSADRITVTFDASRSLDLDGQIVDYQWQFEGGGSASGSVVTHTFPSGGDFYVTLTVTDDDGKTNSRTGRIQISAPTAVFTYSVSGNTATYDPSPSYDDFDVLDRFEWDFGDGQSATTSNPTVQTHTYATDGSYQVSLTVVNELDQAHTQTQTVVIGTGSCSAPVAGFDVDTNLLTVSVSAAPSTGCGLTYDWDFGDGTTATGSSATHPYAGNGSYTISLTVRDDEGRSDTATQVVTVDDGCSAVSAQFSYTLDTLTVCNDATASAGCSLSYTWDFGDGNTASGASPCHTYAVEGTYTVTLTVTDGAGASDTSTTTITVDDGCAELSAAFSASVSDLSVTLDASGSTGCIQDYQWDLGDGQTATGPVVNHTYGAYGQYTVVLSVSDGTTTESTSQVIQLDPPPPPVAAFDISVSGLSISLDGSASTGTNLGYAWDLGDGNTASTAAISHSYTSDGIYAITLTVSDSLGRTDSAQTTVSVSEPTCLEVFDDVAVVVAGTAASVGCYYVSIPSSAFLPSITTTGGTGDVDLYLAKGREASPSDYDSRDTGSGDHSLRIWDRDPGGTWYIGLYGVSDYSGVTLLVKWRVF